MLLSACSLLEHLILSNSRSYKSRYSGMPGEGGTHYPQKIHGIGEEFNETRIRYQMLLLSQQGQTSSQIAQIVLRSKDTVVRVLKRFLTGGLDTVPRRTAPDRERRVTAAWEAELLRVIELDPHKVGQEKADYVGNACC